VRGGESIYMGFVERRDGGHDETHVEWHRSSPVSPSARLRVEEHI